MNILNNIASNPGSKRNSFDNSEIVGKIHASKPKSVFLDGKPSFDKREINFGNKVAFQHGGIQSIRRAAFATETSNEASIWCMKKIVAAGTKSYLRFCQPFRGRNRKENIMENQIIIDFLYCRTLFTKVLYLYTDSYVQWVYFRTSEKFPVRLNLKL